MRVISKKITYDDLVSRIPGILPALVDTWAVPSLSSICDDNKDGATFFSQLEAEDLAVEYGLNTSDVKHESIFTDFLSTLMEKEMGNYGYIPSDIMLPELKDENGNVVEITDYTDLYVNIPIPEELIDDERYDTYYDLSFPVDEIDPHYEFDYTKKRWGIYSGSTDNKKEIKFLSYYTLNKWFCFAEERERIIKNNENKKKYDNYIEYNSNEKLAEDKKYLDLETLYLKRGGDYFYEWMKNNCFLSFKIPKKFLNSWKNDFLYYNQAVKWMNWFDKKDKLYFYDYFIDDERVDFETYEASNSPNKVKKEKVLYYILNIDGEWEETDKNNFNVETDDNKKLKKINVICTETNNCCDCNEYLTLGGHEFFEELSKWVSSVSANTENLSVSVTNSASISFSLPLQNSIDDLGEMTIFSSIWDNDIDYHNTLEPDEMEEPNLGGTVVYLPYKTNLETGKITQIYDTSIIKNDSYHRGYEHNRFYENTYKDDDWNSYTDLYVKSNPEEFASKYITSYTFSKIYNKIIYNPEEEGKEKYFQKTIAPILCDFILINEKPYDVINGKYVEMCYNNQEIANLKFKNHAKLRIHEDGDLEYALLNGKRFFVETINTEKGSEEKIFFLKSSLYEDDGCHVYSRRKYVEYNGVLYFVENDFVNVNDGFYVHKYPVLNGYFILNGVTYFLKKELNGNYTIVLKKNLSLDSGSMTVTHDFYKLEDSYYKNIEISKLECLSMQDKIEILITYKYNIHYLGKITGYTDSKLELLRRKDITTDNLGNEMPGYFRNVIDKTAVESVTEECYYSNNNAGKSNDTCQYYNNPYDGCILDILYKVGDTSNIKVDEYLSNNDKILYTGNIIDKIEFYYTDLSFNKIIGPFEANNDNALEKIEQCENAKKEYTGDAQLYNIMLCDITYYFGAVLEKVRGKFKKLEDAVYNYHSGIKYVDTSFVALSDYMYYINEDSKILVKYYKLTPFKDTFNKQNSDINNMLMTTKFEVEQMLFYYDDNGALEIPNKKRFDRWEGDYDFIATPTFRREYNIGNATPQSLEGNIYIDRGINAAFEKHLKLQEVKNLSSMENFGNNWFKILNN